MKRVAIVTIAVLALASAPLWAQTRTFDWEDGTSTALITYGNAVLENSTEQAHGGTHSLKITETPLGGTPYAGVWWVTGLTDGDQVTASIWVYDMTPSGSPSGRIWGHYTDTDVNSYAGSASGNSTYSDGTGWSQLSYTWTFDSDTDTRDGLLVEARIYSSTELDAIYVDDISIDLLPKMRNRPPKSLWVHPMDHHPNGMVHEEVARIVVEALNDPRATFASCTCPPNTLASHHGEGDDF